MKFVGGKCGARKKPLKKGKNGFPVARDAYRYGGAASTKTTAPARANALAARRRLVWRRPAKRTNGVTRARKTIPWSLVDPAAPRRTARAIRSRPPNRSKRRTRMTKL